MWSSTGRVGPVMEQAVTHSQPIAPGEVRVARALLSVSDKAGIVEFARGLAELGIEIASTGGTASLLAREGIAVRQVQEFTGAPEMLGGRVKTLHPKVHGGILARRKLAADQAEMKAQGVLPIDLVAVNL